MSAFSKKSTSLSLKIFMALAILASVLIAVPTLSSAISVTPAANPAWPNKCGLKIGLLVDRSNSIDTTEGGQLKTAATSFVDALAGTNSQIAVAQFRKTASQTLGLTSITLPAGATTVKNTINGYTFGTSDSDGSTNWEAAFYSQQVVSADIIVILTDGNPTKRGIDGSGGNGSSDPGDLNVDAGITRANELKAQGKRIVAVGIGNDLDVNNLKAVSGPTVNDDYFTSSFAELNAKLADLAKKICGGTVTVVKQVKNADGSYTATNGWDYAATNAVASPKTTAGSGTAEFKYDNTPKNTTITETLKPGYLVESVTCTKGGQTIASSATVSVSFTVGIDDIISCVFKNKPDTATLTVNKIANGDNGTFSFTSTIPSRNNFDITTSGGNGTTGAITIPTGTFDISEVVPTGWNLGTPSCTGASTTVAKPKVTIVATTDANIVCTFTNTRQTATLKVVKNVTSAGGVTDGNFNFTSNTSLGNFSLNTSGGTASTSTVTIPTGTYDISETVPSGWTLTGLGCTGTTPTVANPKVTINATENQTIICTFTNKRDTANVTIKKTANGGDGTFSFMSNRPQGNFNLSTIGGAATTGSFVVPTGTYDFTETVPNDWSLTGISCTGVTPTVANPKVTINVTSGANIECTFTNTRKTANLTIVKNVTAAGGVTDGSFDFTSDTPLGNFNLTTVGGTKSTSTIAIPTGTYNISEVVPSGWSLGTPSCSGTTTTVAKPKVTINAAANENIVCTFTNTRQTANLKVTKKVVSAGGVSDGTFSFTSDTNLGNFNLSTNNGAASTNTVAIPTGNYEIAELVPSGWSLTDLGCEGALTVEGASKVTIAATSGANIECTFENKRDTANITINKTAEGGDSTFSFTSTSAKGNFDLTTIGGTSTTGSFAVPTGSYDFAETVPSDWTLTGISCSGTSATVAKPKVTINASAGDNIVCTFTNKRDTATLKVVKKVVSASGVTDGKFEFTSNTSLGNFDLTTVGGTAETDVISIPTGNYEIAEVVPSGWSLTDLGCEGALTVVGSKKVTIVATAGSKIECTFTNTRQTGSLKVVKTAVGGNATFGFTSDSSLGDFDLTTVDGSAETKSVSVPTGSYEVTESDLDGWSLTGLECSGGEYSTEGSSVSVYVGVESDVVCTFTNTRETGSLKVVKTVNEAGGVTDGTFGFTSNTSLGDFELTTVDGTAETDSVNLPTGSYDLAEVVPSGWSLTGLECSGGEYSTEGSSVSVYVGVESDVVCTFTNTRETGSLKVVKTAVGGNATFGFTSDSPLGDFEITTVGGTGETESVDLPTGSYNLAEILPAGWTLTSASCGFEEARLIGVDAAIQEQAQGVSVSIESGQNVVCTFMNTKEPEVLGTVVTRPTVIDPPVQVKGTSVSSNLAVTGSDVQFVSAFALVLMLAGFGLFKATRRRRALLK